MKEAISPPFDGLYKLLGTNRPIYYNTFLLGQLKKPDEKAYAKSLKAIFF